MKKRKMKKQQRWTRERDESGDGEGETPRTDQNNEAAENERRRSGEERETFNC